MHVERTTLNGVLLIKPDTYEDFRGVYVEAYNKKEFKKHGIDVDFVTHDFSTSFYRVLRGMHGDNENYKLIWCGEGRLFLAVVNPIVTSSQYGKWEGFTLTDANHHMVLVPPKFGNGHQVLSQKARFCYLQSAYYNPKRQFSIKYDDPRFKVRWPLKDPILSPRDEAGKYV